MKTATYSVLFFLVTSLAHAAEITLVDENEIGLISESQNALDRISSRVTSCLVSGGKYPICLCKNKDSILEFNRLVLSIFERYPEWLEAEKITYTEPSGINTIIFPAAMHSQASEKLECN